MEIFTHIFMDLLTAIRYYTDQENATVPFSLFNQYSVEEVHDM